MPFTLLKFGDFELDSERFELLRFGHPLRLERKPLELLILLAAHRDRLITRAEIAEHLWSREVFVDTEHGINTAVRKLRQALRDDSGQPRYIQTVTGKGYRFIAQIETPSSPPFASIANGLSDPALTEPIAAPGPIPLTRPHDKPSRLLRLPHRVWLWALPIFAIALVITALRGTSLRRKTDVSGRPLINRTLLTASNVSEAREAYTHGWYLWYAGHIDASLPYFRRATELDPDYAPGWIGLSLYYGEGALIGRLDPSASLQEQETTALKAVQLDDTSPEAHLALASAIFARQWNWPAALAELDRALALDPRCAEAYHVRAKILSVLNRPQESVVAQARAIELDPSARPWAMAFVLYFARQYDAAQKEALQRLEAKPQDTDLLEVLTDIYESKGMYSKAAETRERWLLSSGDSEGAEHVRRAFRRGGYKEVYRLELAVLKKNAATTYVSPVALAVVHAQLGDRDETLSLLEESLQQHAPDLLLIQNLNMFDFLHTDPRYRSVIRSIGLPPAY